MGANFYTPNIFVKSVKELPSKLLDSDSGSCKYSIDVMIISGISIEFLEESCHILSKFVTKNTTILMSADFGCELEKIALNSMGEHCKCVLSIACDVECRQLSLGSYALVNDDNCEIYFGVTCSPDNYVDNSMFASNAQVVVEELEGCNGSSVSRMISQLEVTKWIKIGLFKSSQEMALKVWKLIIPKISLNILSIIYEQFDYEKMLENKSTEIIFKGLVHELLEICLAQCKCKVREFLSEDVDDDGCKESVDFVKVIAQCKTKRMELITTTANEYPEYLFLPFESYCFYHRFEYPAQILLYQPILLAEELGVSCSNLNFLYGFYTRLLSLSGLSINGGRINQENLQLGGKLIRRSSSSSSKKFKQGNRSKSKSKRRQDGNETTESHCIFSVASPAGADYKLPSDAVPESCKDKKTSNHSRSINEPSVHINEGNTGHSGSGSEEGTEDLQYDDKEADYFLSARRRSQVFARSSSSASGNLFQGSSREISSNAQNELNNATTSQLSKKYNPKAFALTTMSAKCPVTAAKALSLNERGKAKSTSNLELQLHSSSNLGSSSCDDLYKQLFDLSIKPASQTDYDSKRKQYAEFEKQVWQFQRQCHLMNGTIARPKLGPYDELLNYIEVLCGENNNEIIRFTTSRYGDLDLYSSLQRDKDHIASLFEKYPQLDKTRLIKGSRNNTMGRAKLPHSR